MLTSLALIFLAGLAMATLCSLLRLPRIIACSSPESCSAPMSWSCWTRHPRHQCRPAADGTHHHLIKAGLSLDLGDLRRVGRPAVLMSFLPASFEILAYILFAPMLLGITRLEAAVVMILLALCVRAVGVLLALTGTRLDWKERLFCVIAYLPKATVQAAIGSVPLAMGPPCGALVLSVAVLAILITAPLGAIGIDSTCRRLLRPAD